MADTSEEDRLRSRWADVGLALAIVVLLWGSFALWQLFGAERDPHDALLLPPAGEVAAAFVDDRPVFVVHDYDGSVRVLDGVSPHAPDPDRPKLVAWCRSSEAFEDLWHGARFTRDGDWVGGPGPTGLAAYAIVERTDAWVRVEGRGPAPPRPEHDLDWEPAGPACAELGDPAAVGDPLELDAVVAHTPRDDGEDRFQYVTADNGVVGDAPG